MRPRDLALVGLLLGVAAFLFWTSRSLPPVVASHFGFGGRADGFMPRGGYVASMIGLVLFLPLFVTYLPALLDRGGARWNLPHREYWLAPERRAESVAFVLGHGAWLAGALALFLAYTHVLVVRANALTPPVLSTGGMIAGLAALVGVLAVWLGVLFARFRRHE